MSDGFGISVYGMQRSGTHAVTNWIADQFDGRMFYANDCFNCHTDIVSNFKSDELPVFSRKRIRSVDFESAAEADVSILVYEDARLWECWPGENRAFEGKQTRLKVLILRDPFNLIASRIKLTERIPTPFLQERMLSMDEEGVPIFITTWKSYAREFIRLRDAPEPGHLLVNYNEWVSNKDYRRDISASLGRVHRDREKESVPGDGFGSSFDGIDFNQNASRMRVLERWKEFESDKRFSSWTSDKVMKDLSSEIFGEVMDFEPCGR
jgi:hypothetical protein